MNQIPDNHPIIFDLLPAYAISALDSEESAQVFQHLAVCPICREELRTCEEVAAQLTLAVAPQVAPPHSLEERLMQGIHGRASRPLAAAARRSTVLRRLVLLPAIRWGVAGVALIVLVFVIALKSDLAGTPGRAQTVTLIGTDAAPDARGTFILDAPNTARLEVVGLQPLDQSQQYQLWLVQSDDTRDSGAVFSVQPDGTAVVPVALPQHIDAYRALGITIEPAGGSPKPTGARVLAGEF